MSMSTITARVDEDVRRRADAVIRRAGTTQSEVIRTVWMNIADTGRLPGREGRPSTNPMLARLDALRERTPKAPCLSNMTPGDVKKELETRG